MKNQKKVFQSLTLILQFGLNMIVPIVLCMMFGIWLGRKYDILWITIPFFVMMKFNLGNLFTAFIGVLGLKISAYLQPFTHKFVLKLQGRVETPSESSDN